MKIAKIMNNNVVSALDEGNREIIVLGKGIGFQKHNGDLIDEAKVEKIFRLSEPARSKFEKLVEEIPYEYVSYTDEIVREATETLGMELNKNIYITLTDHLHFAIERYRRNITFQNALLWEIKGFLALFVAVGVLDGAGGTYNILYSLGDAAFYFLPVLLGYTAAKRFKLPEMEGMIIGCSLLYPYVLGSSGMDVSHLFGIPVSMPPSGDYSSSVMPIIVAVAFAAWFEKKIKKHMPDTIKMFAVPLTTCFVTVCLTFWIIGPVTSLVSSGLSAAFAGIAKFSPILLGIVVGGLWMVLVMFGLHWALIPLSINDMSTMGYSTILTGFFAHSFILVGRCLRL